MHKSLFKILGSISISLGIILILSFLILNQFNAQLDNIDTIIDNTFDTYLAENQEEIKQSLIEEDPEIQKIFEACDKGELSEEECTLSEDNPLLTDTVTEGKAELKNQLILAFQIVKDYAKFNFYAYILGALLILLGTIFIFIGTKPDWLLFAQKIFGKIGFSFAIPFLVVWYVLSLTKEDYIEKIRPIAEGAPEILLSFLGILIENIIQPVFQPFYKPFMFIFITFISFWLIILTIRIVEGKKVKNSKKKK